MIPMTDKVLNPEARARAVDHYREKGIALPTFAQMKDPSLIPDNVRARLKNLGLWDLDPMNLFRITWKNEPIERGGLYGDVNAMELPKELTGVDARIVVMIGKWFPTGAHKVGAAYGCLAPKLVSGEFDPSFHKAVWPSTGNYCRGGAFDSYLMDCTSIAILPEEMSRERFEWLATVSGEIIATPGCESNVKEIYDMTWKLREDPKIRIANQFEVMANYRFHYYVTGNSAAEAVAGLAAEGICGADVKGFISSMGSSGTIAAGDRLKQLHRDCKIVGLEPTQCPTIYSNGFGGHDIQGIGDKHVTWIHNVMNMDAIMCVDDVECKQGLQLLTDPVGQEYLAGRGGVPGDAVETLSGIMGISGVCNVLGAIKTAKYWGLGKKDTIVTVATDAIDRYHSVMKQLDETYGAMDEIKAAVRHEHIFRGQKIDWISEGSHAARNRWFNLKYYTWVEQQGKTVEELEAQRSQDWWVEHQERVAEVCKEQAERRAASV